MSKYLWRRSSSNLSVEISRWYLTIDSALYLRWFSAIRCSIWWMYWYSKSFVSTPKCRSVLLACSARAIWVAAVSRSSVVSKLQMAESGVVMHHPSKHASTLVTDMIRTNIQVQQLVIEFKHLCERRCPIITDTVPLEVQLGDCIVTSESLSEFSTSHTINLCLCEYQGGHVVVVVEGLSENTHASMAQCVVGEVQGDNSGTLLQCFA